jgi:DNA-binding response OmpR family regulator
MPDAPRFCAVVVEDEATMRELVTMVLRDEGFDVRSASDGAHGVELVRAVDPDLVVLDLGLPDVGGVEVCQRLRTFSSAYIIMLTAKADEVDKIVGLTVGADDYVTKPFSPRELSARVQALLRRPRRQTTTPTRVFGDLVVDPTARAVRVGGDEASLTRTEFDLLDILSASPRRVFTRRQLIERVWGPDWYGDEHGIDVHISNLRRKIQGPNGTSYVLTVRGVGYRMADVT